MAEKRVVILIIAHRAKLHPLEIISLKQCIKVLGSYPITLVTPIGLNVESYKKIDKNIKFDFIDPKWQASYASFNRLKIEPFIYERYKAYDFILFYELDSLVFRNELQYWLDQDYDYIGAPVKINSAIMPLENDLNQFYFNGGFSLRKVESHLRVLHTYRKLLPQRYIKKWYSKYNTNGKIANIHRYLGMSLGYQNNTHYENNFFRRNEDVFWSFYVPKVIKWFRLPDSKQAIKFSFDKDPELLYKRNNDSLPFGCHAWYRKDENYYPNNLKFWSTILERKGIELPSS
jgi:hypothetical protein